MNHCGSGKARTGGTTSINSKLKQPKTMKKLVIPNTVVLP